MSAIPTVTERRKSSALGAVGSARGAGGAAQGAEGAGRPVVEGRRVPSRGDEDGRGDRECAISDALRAARKARAEARARRDARVTRAAERNSRPEGRERSDAMEAPSQDAREEGAQAGPAAAPGEDDRPTTVSVECQSQTAKHS